MESLIPILDKLVSVGIFAIIIYLVIALIIVGGVFTFFVFIFRGIVAEERRINREQAKWDERLRR